MVDNSRTPKSGRRNPNGKVWKIFQVPSASEFKDYGKETSLHGLKYVFQSQRHHCERIFWTISFVSGILMATFLINGSWRSYLKNPVVVTYQVEETKISRFPFPAVTYWFLRSANEAASLVLNQYGSGEAWTKAMNESLKTHLKALKCIDYACQVPALFGSTDNSVENSSLYVMLLRAIDDVKGNLNVTVDIEEKDVEDILGEATHSCDEIALYCRWGNTEYNCSEFFSIQATDEGYCCSFNTLPYNTVVELNNMYDNAAKERSWGINPSSLEAMLGKISPYFDLSIRTWLENTAKIRTQQTGGRTEGLSIVLNPQLEENYCSGFNGPGFVFRTHLPVNTPVIAKYSTPIPPRTEVFVSIIPEAIFADVDIKSFDIEKRRCFFEGESNLKIFATYTRENCIKECEADLIEGICGCQILYINLMMNNTCGPHHNICVSAALRRLTSKTVAERCSHCLSTCNELHYIQNVVTSPISQRNSKFHTGQSRAFYENWFEWKKHKYTGCPKNRATPGTEPFHNIGLLVKKGASILHVYFEHDSFYARERKQLYSWTDLIANIGGLLGLCLGFSGLSLIEVIYFFTIRPFFKRRGIVSPEIEQATRIIRRHSRS